MMPRKWICFEAELGGDLHRFVGKLSYPFDKALAPGRGDGFASFECLMRESAAGWRPYPDAVVGASGQASLRRERIVAFFPLRESAAHWEGVWRALTPP